eukprot:snap_masked-scaffold_4-processed-gene-10.13-mRNA-1 protein AED:1.00 eAED:1.00 QI:0/0/0/0/1/1/2/0/94
MILFISETELTSSRSCQGPANFTNRRKLREVGQEGVERLEKANENASQNGKGRWFNSEADSSSTGVAMFVCQRLIHDVTEICRVIGSILTLKIR